MQIGDTITLAAVRPPQGVTLLDEPDAVIATLSPPRLQAEAEAEEEIEAETELVGEGEPAAEAPGAGEAPEDAGSAGASGGE
jgi:large subunit ribosomal protein L25